MQQDVVILKPDGTHEYATMDIPEPEPQPEPSPTITERVASLEATKAERADVDEIQEALDMILTGVTE